MLRTIDIIMIGLLLGGAAFTFKIKQDSEAAIERVAELESRIKAEQDAIDVLKADWSLLTDPKRLQALVQRYNAELHLAPIDSRNIGTIAEIPERAPTLPAESDTDITDLIDADSSIRTGSIAPAESDPATEMPVEGETP